MVYGPLKSNRLVDDSGGQQPNQPVGCLSWSNAEVEWGKTLKAKGMLNDCKRKLFRVRVSTRQTDYLMTNEVEPATRPLPSTKAASAGRWSRFTANASSSPACRLASAGWPAASATTSPGPCGPGPSSNKPPTRPKKGLSAQKRVFGCVHASRITVASPGFCVSPTHVKKVDGFRFWRQISGVCFPWCLETPCSLDFHRLSVMPTF